MSATPISEYLSAQAVIALISYGGLNALDDGRPIPGMPPMMARWGSVPITTSSATPEIPYGPVRRDPLLWDMRYVLARTRWHTASCRHARSWRRCPLPPLGNKHRARIRALFRRYHLPVLDLSSYLKEDLALQDEALAAHNLRLHEATAILCKAILEGKIVAWGRPRNSRTGALKAPHEAIPSSVFTNSQNMILLNRWTASGPYTKSSADGPSASPVWG